MSARAAVYDAIHHRDETARQRKLYSTLSHAVTTAGLLAMIVGSSVETSSSPAKCGSR